MVLDCCVDIYWCYGCPERHELESERVVTILSLLQLKICHKLQFLFLKSELNDIPFYRATYVRVGHALSSLYVTLAFAREATVQISYKVNVTRL